MPAIWSIKALSTLFGFNTRKMVAVTWAVYVISIAGILLCGTRFWNFDGVLILFEVIQVSLLAKALVAQKSGAGIITAGFAVSISAATLSSVVQYWDIHVSLLWFQTFIGITYIAPALGISLYLAREFALKSGLLREKLVQVELLSKKNLAQEQEKQLLLFQQNERLEAQVAQRTSALHGSLEELRATQEQLIQAEKMASLGELTAGIAHEIKNPLNFINNFSELSTELLDEMGEELRKGAYGEAEAISADLKQNLEKICHHGKRADNIVKGMLEHSRSASARKQPTDIIKLANECLQLSYKSFQLKDSFFIADITMDAGGTLAEIVAVPQDIGRVLSNMFSNAFYALQQRQKRLGHGYNPALSVKIYQASGNVIIEARDNGTGISKSIMNKIM
ncbi:sensor histidine kinase [Mucilaginibacter pedocola]|uniref:histidine kinase n=1 Tax=Mucilaginibacter pedocola TaxID=1792845 RepID=A0A1S9PLV2_9SPHI|nr:histidine kinase dimerization/phospho-acceptor domain-containing protein [Mucilaginibacter pedocola]OOQ61538.1 hypothetical protein BC343_00205 [Mucilaginibacter pedocola]